MLNMSIKSTRFINVYLLHVLFMVNDTGLSLFLKGQDTANNVLKMITETIS
jgi:ammonia channel protein AmtB